MPVLERPKLRKRVAEKSPQGTVAASLDGQNLRWLHEVRHLAQHDQLEEAMDILALKIDTWLCNGNFEDCDHLLRDIAPEWLNLSLSLAILALTKPASMHLKYRAKFYQSLRTYLSPRPDCEALLKGLAH